MNRLLERLTGWLELVLGLALIGCVLLNFANAMARYVFGGALFGVDELQVYTVIASAYLAAILVYLRNDHLRMDALVSGLPAELRRVLRGLEHLLVVAVAGFATAQSTIYAWQMLKLDRRSDVMEIPMWVPHGALAVGLGAIVLIALWRFASEFLLGRPVGHAAPMSGRTQGDVA